MGLQGYTTEPTYTRHNLTLKIAFVRVFEIFFEIMLINSTYKQVMENSSIID